MRPKSTLSLEVELRRGAPLTYRCALVFAALMALGLLGWLARNGAVIRDEIRMATQRAVRVAELRGTIAYLDEWLTMSTEMAAASGERGWVERYEEAVPKLDAAVREAADLATPEIKGALESTTGEAYRDLIIMERRVLDLAAGGDLAAARKLLHGPEFAYLKDVYATGLDVFGQDLGTLADKRASELNDQAWMEISGLGFSATLLVSIALMMRGHLRLQRALARTAIVARTDALTNLPNRRGFYEQFGPMLADKSPVTTAALLLVDLDRFKAANDGHGHLAGDELLQLVALRLRDVVRASDLVARLGGDEFAVVIVNRDIEQYQVIDPAIMAERIIDALTEPFVLKDGTTIRISATIGVVLVHKGDDIASSMHRADVALYLAKAAGRGCFRFFEDGKDFDVRSRALLEGELRQAIVEQTIMPYFQPFVNIQSGRLLGVEILARWQHPIRGMVPPTEFIPIAEDLGLIGLVTENLLRRACYAAARWPPEITIACNVSSLQLKDPELPSMVRSVLSETGLPCCRLEIEITESALVADFDLARVILLQLKEFGIRLALDDFGTGYSSLRHLQMLPFDKLKIDGSFVATMLDSRESGKIVSAVVGLGRSLGLSTVAEGVETEETAAALRELGCDLAQGWLFGRPVPDHEIDLLLRDINDATALVA
jgi:diguanylate cyclase (GGDEF)-like protein